MTKKKHGPEQIVAILRQIELAIAKHKPAVIWWSSPRVKSQNPFRTALPPKGAIVARPAAADNAIVGAWALPDGHCGCAVEHSETKMAHPNKTLLRSTCTF